MLQALSRYVFRPSAAGPEDMYIGRQFFDIFEMLRRQLCSDLKTHREYSLKQLLWFGSRTVLERKIMKIGTRSQRLALNLPQPFWLCSLYEMNVKWHPVLFALRQSFLHISNLVQGLSHFRFRTPSIAVRAMTQSIRTTTPCLTVDIFFTFRISQHYEMRICKRDRFWTVLCRARKVFFQCHEEMRAWLTCCQVSSTFWIRLGWVALTVSKVLPNEFRLHFWASSFAELFSKCDPALPSILAPEFVSKKPIKESPPSMICLLCLAEQSIQEKCTR